MSLTQLWIDRRVNSRSDRFLLRALATAGPLTGLATMLTPTVRWVQRCQPLGEFEPKPWICVIIDIFRKVFRSHGEFCATQPWEVMIRKNKKMLLTVKLSGDRGHAHLPRLHPHRVGEAQWAGETKYPKSHLPSYCFALRFLVSPPPLPPHGAWWSWWWWPSSGDQPSCSQLLM